MMSSPTREQFIDQVFQVVTKRFPLVKLAEGDEPFTVKVNGNLVSLENIYRMSALKPEEMRHNIERWVVELLRAAEGSPDRELPYEELKERVLPMILPENSAAHEGVVSEPLVEGLRIGYAIDNDRTIAYIPQAHFANWEVTLEDLHDTAIENLVRRSEQMSAHAAQDEDGNISLIIFQTMDGYDASRVLLPTLHDRLREHLGSPFCAGIPNRDILLCFRNDDETVSRMRAQIKEDFKKMPHQVTDQLLLVTADGIAVRE
jgi:uncharacterized protein YtpQ (UPF0354 family)